MKSQYNVICLGDSTLISDKSNWHCHHVPHSISVHHTCCISLMIDSVYDLVMRITLWYHIYNHLFHTSSNNSLNINTSVILYVESYSCFGLDVYVYKTLNMFWWDNTRKWEILYLISSWHTNKCNDSIIP